ncbi:tRNA pseudouridine(38-40) synthase TruA [Gammaproteobacteria bacterium]|nr:tRNA pseudouridine(38-40) synthase TruA [Gammaproteobacteria bacterium]
MGQFRLAMGIAYQGTDFAGFQEQPGLTTIQSVLEQAIAKVANHAVKLVVSGRTDRGVHATGQVIHVDVEVFRENHCWLRGINTWCPSSVQVLWVKSVNFDFHARFSALSRIYHYQLLLSDVAQPFWYQRALWMPNKLDIEAMQVASQVWVGTHDFSSFRTRYCQARSPVKTIIGIRYFQKGDIVTFEFHGSAFLHQMVRRMMAALILIGKGKKPTDYTKWLIQVSDYQVAALSPARPHGLYLAKIIYE